jgi:hypothetical protein
MTTPPDSPDDPNWLDEFEDLANQELQDGSACEQVHPIVEKWFQKLMAGAPPESRPSVAQAMACLSTEILNQMPDELVDPILEHVPEDDFALWIEHILLVGRAFEIALRTGELDDL